MKHTGKNISVLDKMMTTDSLSPEHNGKFGVYVIDGYLNSAQAHLIINRATSLYSKIITLKTKIYELYGTEPTDRLVSNFNEIIIYSDKVLSHPIGECFDEFFQKLEGFCGQIENILKMIRYYYSIFIK